MKQAVTSVVPGVSRITSLDVMRGLVMVLMALDHVRVYSGLPAGGPTPGIFFTRWVTHFCAPAFVFFAGTSAFLAGRTRSRPDLARYLLIRGALLVLLELTVIRVAWTFNLDYAHYLLAGVIWMLGVCMMLMAVLVRLPAAAIGTFGLLMIAGHNVVDLLPPAKGSRMLQFLYFGGVFKMGAGGPFVAVLYSIVPWIGVMAAGYAFGAIMVRGGDERRRLCLTIGLAATALFVVLRGLDVYGDPRHWRAGSAAVPVLFRFLSTTKYPGSLLFLLMTLGPTIALLPLAARARGIVSNTLALFGRVPLFYYLLHIPVIHAMAMVVSLAREGRVNPWLFENHPMMPPPVPDGYAWPLPLLYLVFVGVIAILYVPCRWFARVKAEHRHGLVSYL
ncbi:MAG TPA: heparan-alpha-glucosaminide N-acetyltransferase domain-containing protein [Thermoanaerobaculia bacterium]